MPKALTPAERRHLAKVKALPCGLCGRCGPNHAHHVRTGQGMGQRAGHFCTVPLCPDCHEGPQGIHGDKTLWRIYRKTEMDVLDQTNGILMEGSQCFY
ncbi:MAG: DUF968 domain-containing protein [Salinibacterium sp.]|nr:DUF968 domain-containing protein [Salinibacterium sp.]